uniref:Uncharacterized protein n=1 Tax=Anguilla anguilla TaxID=7936 RepID=A0A0E9PI55_ANGAN
MLVPCSVSTVLLELVSA